MTHSSYIDDVRKKNKLLSVVGLFLLLLGMAILTSVAWYRAKVATQRTIELAEANKKLSQTVTALKDNIIKLSNQKDVTTGIIQQFVPKKDSLVAVASTIVNNGNVTLVPQEIGQTTNVQIAQRIEESIGKNDKKYWIYLGQRFGTKWKPKNFNFSGQPTEGIDITAYTAVYKREKAPDSLAGGIWKLGRIVGVVDSGKQVHVLKVRGIEDDNWWACVEDAAVSTIQFETKKRFVPAK